MSPSRLTPLVLVLVLSACADSVTDPLTAPPTPSRGISDAVHGDGGNPHFFWLPPMAAQPSSKLLGAFEHLASPRVVVVCQESNQLTSCDGETPIASTVTPGLLAEFELGSGLLREEDHFKVELSIRAFGLSVSNDDGAYTTYRILVYTDPLEDFGGPFILGHADLRVGETSEAAATLGSGDVIGVVAGRTVPVRFRIDQGAYAHSLRVNLAEAEGDPDGELCQERCSVTLIDPDDITLASLDDDTGLMVTAIQFQPGDLPETAVLVIDERTTGEDGNCADGILVEKKYCYRYRIIPDVEFNKPVRFGICPRELPINDDLAWRIHKVDYQDRVPVLTYPEEVDVSDFLPCTDVGGTAFLGRALRYASHWLVAPLFAQTTTRTWGGMARDLSDLFWGRAFDDAAPFDTWLLVEPAEPVTLCWPEGDACQSSIALTAEATGPPGTYAQPWDRVHFYYRPGTGSHAPTLIGEDTNPSVREDGSVMVYTWSIALSAQGLPAGGLDVFAIGLDTDGNAYQTPFNSNITVVPGNMTAPLFAQGTASDSHVCMLTGGGAAYCWGDNPGGQLGNGTIDGSSLPAPVTGGLLFQGISTGSLTTCAWTAAGRGYCWGDGRHGALGNGTTLGSLVPTPVAGDLAFEGIEVGVLYACGLTAGGTAHCWGWNLWGRLGTGDTEDSSVPRPVAGGLAFRTLSVGLSHACGLTADGTAYCWGSGSRLGTGDTEPRAEPTLVAGEIKFASITAGATTTCGIDTGGVTYCWGQDFFGSLGQGGTTGHTQLVPAPVTGGLLFNTVGQGNANRIYTPSCGIDNTGNAYCWGANAYGALGTREPTETCGPISSGSEVFTCTGFPTAVEGGLRFKAIYPSGGFTCALTINDEPYCWGVNSAGQLGTGGMAPGVCNVRGFDEPCSFVPLRVGASP